MKHYSAREFVPHSRRLELSLQKWVLFILGGFLYNFFLWVTHFVINIFVVTGNFLISLLFQITCSYLNP